MTFDLRSQQNQIGRKHKFNYYIKEGTQIIRKERVIKWFFETSAYNLGEMQIKKLYLKY